MTLMPSGRVWMAPRCSVSRKSGLIRARAAGALAALVAAQQVGDPDLLAASAGFDQQFVEDVASRAAVGDAGGVICRAGGFADEHQVGVRVAGAEDDLPARLGPAAGPAA